jgi:hypothetical protein
MFLGLPDPLDRGTDPRIRIRIRILTKMSRIHSTARNFNYVTIKYYDYVKWVLQDTVKVNYFR